MTVSPSRSRRSSPTPGTGAVPASGSASSDVAASASAWGELESYLGKSVRASLTAQARRLTAQADRLLFSLRAARSPADLTQVRSELLTLRRQYAKAEAIVDFYGHAVTTRSNPTVAAILRGLDELAVHSMDQVLRPLGIETPPVLTYLDKGLGASILRAGARLWDASLSPAAAIKVTRHNLWQPTSLVHETGHQVAHLVGWVPELAAALSTALASRSPIAAEAWSSLGERGRGRRLRILSARLRPGPRTGDSGGRTVEGGVPDALR